MEKLIEQIRLKADACGNATKEQRARKGAYVDCLVMMKEALHKPDVGRSVCGFKGQCEHRIADRCHLGDRYCAYKM